MKEIYNEFSAFGKVNSEIKWIEKNIKNSLISSYLDYLENKDYDIISFRFKIEKYKDIERIILIPYTHLNFIRKKKKYNLKERLRILIKGE